MKNEKFLLHIPTKCCDIANEILNAVTDAEQNFQMQVIQLKITASCISVSISKMMMTQLLTNHSLNKNTIYFLGWDISTEKNKIFLFTDVLYLISFLKKS